MGASLELPRRHRSARALGPGPPRRELLEAGREPPCPAAEIGGGPGPLPVQVAAARRVPRRAELRRLRGKRRGHLCRDCGLRSPGRLSDLFPVGCRGSWRQRLARSPRGTARLRKRWRLRGKSFLMEKGRVGEAVPAGRCGWAERIGRQFGAVRLGAQRRPPVGAGERWRCGPGGAVAGLRSPADFSQELWEAPGRAPVPCSPADSLTFTGCPAAGLPVAGLLPSQGASAAPPPSGASASALLRGGDRGPFVPDPC